MRTKASSFDWAFRALWPALLPVAGFSLAFNVLTLAMPLYTMQVYDRVMPSRHVETLLYLTLAAGFALAVMALFDAVRAQALGRIGGWLERTLGADLVRAAVAARLAGSPAGAQPLRDLGLIRNVLGGPAICPLFDAPWTPLFIAVLWALHPWIGFLALASTLALFALALANDRWTRGAIQSASQEQIAAFEAVEAMVRNAGTIQAMGMLPALLKRWSGDAEALLAAQERAGDRAALVMAISKFLRAALQTGIMGLCAWLVLRREMAPGAMMASTLLFAKALAPVDQVMGSWRQLVAARLSGQRIQALLGKVPERPPAMRLPAPRGDLAVDRLTFVPPGSGGPPVLRGVSFHLPAGTVLGVVGPSAAGKSTLCRLLVGIHPPSAGSVRLDGAEVHAWERADFGRHAGYLPQEVELFPGTVRDNIARMGEADPEAVVEAARLADVHAMILHLPDGYDTVIAPGNTGRPGAVVLSGGQRQRLGLARALFGAPKLLVLDEPNAHLDQAGEAALLRAVEAMRRQGTTVVMIAHRPAVLANADRLLCLRAGALEMFGPREEVERKLAGPRRTPPVPRLAAAAGSPALGAVADAG